MSLSSLVGQPRQEPPQRVGFPLFVRFCSTCNFLFLLFFLRRDVCRIGARREALRRKEEILDDLHRERFAEERRLELEARLLCGVEEVRGRERVKFGEIG